MGNTTQKVNLLQTAYNVAGTVTAALVQAGVTTDAQGALEAIKREVFKDLVEVHGSEPAAPRSNYPSPTSGGGDLDPGTVVIKGQYRHAGKTIAEVYDLDPSYVQWLANKGRNAWLKERAARYIAKVSGNGGAPVQPAATQDPSYF